MAKTYLDSGDTFIVANNNSTVFGAAGTESVTIQAGVTGTVLDQNTESVKFNGAVSAFTFQQTGNLINVYSGATLVAKFPVQGDADGTLLTFTNGTVSAKLTAGVLQFGGTAVSATAPAAVVPTTIDTTVVTPGGGTATPTFSITGAAAVAEGASATYTVTLSAAQSGATSVDYTLAGTGGAVLGTDTGVVANGTLNFAAGEVTKTIVVPFSSDSVTPEAGEGVSVTLSGPSLGTALSATAATVTTAITDVPVQFSVAPNAAAVNEGDSVTFTVTLSVAQATASTVTYTLTGAGGAVLGTDTGVNAPVGNTGTLTFAAGETSKTIVVPIAKDTISPEAGEGVTLTLTTPSVGALSATAAAATATITDVPVTYTLTASAASVYEGAPITYTLTASAPASAATTVDFSVVPGASTAANDQGTGLTNLNDFTQSSFNPTSFVIAAGATTATYVVTSATDSLTELPETYSVKAVIGGTEVATKSTTLLDGASANAGQTFTLTTGVDLMPAALKGSNGNTNTAGNDLIVGIVGTSATLSGADDVNGGDGIDTLRVISDLATDIPLAAVSNVEIIDVRSASLTVGSIDTSAKAGVTNLNITSATDGTSFTATAAATTDISVSGGTTALIVKGGKNVTVTDATDGKDITVSTSGATKNAVGTITVTDTKQGNADIKVDGGTDVTVTATSDAVTKGITIGANKAASGAVKVTQNLTSDGAAALDNSAKIVAVTGGKTIDVTINGTSTATVAGSNAALSLSKVTALGDSKTTDVTVKQAATVTNFTSATVAETKATQTVTFKAMATGETATVGLGGQVLTFTASKALTANEAAQAFVGLINSDTQSATGPTANGIYSSLFAAAWQTSSVTGAVVSFVANASGTATLVVGGTAAPTLGTLVAGTAASGGVKTNNSVAFGDVDVQDNATAAITHVTVDGFKSAKLGISASAADTLLDTITHLTLANNTTGGDVDLATTATALDLTVSNITAAGTAVVNLDHDGNGTAAGSKTIKDLTINTVGGASAFALQAGALANLTVNAAVGLDISNTPAGYATAALKTVDINGAGAVNLGDIAAAALKTFNAADNTGGVTATISAKTSVLDAAFTKYVFSEGSDTVTLKTVDVNKAIDLGTGNDTIELKAGVRIGDITANIDGGAGTNTLKLAADDAEALSAANTFNAKIDKFQHLTIGAAASQEVVNLDNIDAISYVTLGSGASIAQAVTLTDAAAKNAGATKYEAGDIITVTVNGKTLAYTLVASDVAADDAVLNGHIIAAINADAVLNTLVTAVATDKDVITLTSKVPGVAIAASMAFTLDKSADGTDTFTPATSVPNGPGITLNNLANNGTVSLTDTTSVLVSVKDAALVTSTTDVLNLQTQVNGKSFAVTANDVETIKVNAIDTYTAGGVANKDATTLAVVADKATKVMVSGDGYVSLSTTAAVLTEVDAGTMTGGLTYTAKLASLVVKGGLGVDSLTAAGDDVKLYGGAGDDTLTVTSGLRVNLYGDAGKDTFVFNAGASNTLDAYTVINGVSTGDVIKMTGATAFSGSKIALSVGADETLLNYANQAIKTLGLNEMGWFEKGGNTFIVKDGHNTTDAFDTTTDMIIMITGVVNLGTGASYNSTSNILEIV